MAEPSTGARIGRYQLVAPIGAGGMGQVWVARDDAAPTLRLVALKTTLGGADAGMNADFGTVLADEATLASRINHPNVCATHELGRDGAVHFLVMEWSDGASLRDVLSASPGQRIAPELVAFIGASVAAGLHAAHELTDDQGGLLGVVHRDVSPQNILISTHGHVRLADFGVAKARGQLHRPTETGEVKGKLSYMAPEQVTSKGIDRRADIFALGCVLYEAALGVRPFHGADALATMYKILEEELTPPRALNASFPAGLESVLVKALAKEPSERYETAEELREALLEYLGSTRRPYTDKHVAELLGGVFGASLKERNRMILTAAEQLLRGETDPARLATPTPPVQTQTLTPDGGVERSAAVTRKEPRAHRTIAMPVVAAALGTLLVLGAWSIYGQRRVDSENPALAATTTSVVAAPAILSLAPEVSPTPIVGATQAGAPLPSSIPTPPRRGGSRASVPPKPATSASSNAAALAKPPPTKKPRPIDRDNPFDH
ncbi:MAG TPA: protein kinase [Polyangiaceae bacterium]